MQRFVGYRDKADWGSQSDRRIYVFTAWQDRLDYIAGFRDATKTPVSTSAKPMM
jgi:hypothetical protein